MRLALLQLSSPAGADEAVRHALDELARAPGDAEVLCLPEAVFGFDSGAHATHAWSRADPGALAPFLAWSAGTDALILLGGTWERAAGAKIYNTSVALRSGRIVARYRKVHLFDAELPSGERLAESERTLGGGEMALLRSGGWGFGFSVCYDLRFPAVFAALRAAGADVLCVPSAFTESTGRAHWESLLRARAIETGAYVVAAAQCGDHGRGRRSYGRSLVVDPWGRVLVDAGTEVGCSVVTLQPDAVNGARRALPTHRHFNAAACERVAHFDEGAA